MKEYEKPELNIILFQSAPLMADSGDPDVEDDIIP